MLAAESHTPGTEVELKVSAEAMAVLQCIVDDELW